jgi:hypothetical protein
LWRRSLFEDSFYFARAGLQQGLLMDRRITPAFF